MYIAPALRCLYDVLRCSHGLAWSRENVPRFFVELQLTGSAHIFVVLSCACRNAKEDGMCCIYSVAGSFFFCFRITPCETIFTRIPRRRPDGTRWTVETAETIARQTAVAILISLSGGLYNLGQLQTRGEMYFSLYDIYIRGLSAAFQSFSRRRAKS